MSDTNDTAPEDAGAPADLNAEKREQVAKLLKSLACGRLSAAAKLADLLVPVDTGAPPATLGAELLALGVVEQGGDEAPATRKPRAKRADA